MKLAFACLCALSLLAISVASPASADAGVVFEASRALSASFAARVTAGASGEFQAEIASSGNFRGGSTEGFGMLLYKGDGSFWFGIGITGSISGERTIVNLGALDENAQSAIDGGSMRFTVGTSPGNSIFVVAWGAGLERVDFRILGAPGTLAIVNEGTAMAAGDAELEGGAPNVQLQKNYATYQGVGVKLVRDARADVAAERALHGFWLHNNVKFVCQGQCVSPGAVHALCDQLADASCDTTRISWSGPGGAGASGAPSYALLNAPAGAYTFREDLKVDAYATSGQYLSTTGTLVIPYEDYTYLSLADVALPNV